MTVVQLRLAVLGLAVSGAVCAQGRTWVVDAAAGPGHDFTDLPAALAAAAHGDRIVARPGAYRGATTDRGVTVVGDRAQLTTTLRVTGLPLDAVFALQGFHSTARLTPLVCRDNAGRIHLDRLTFEIPVPASPFAFEAGLLISRCRAVTATDCTFRGSPGVRVETSLVELTGCTLRGLAGFAWLKIGVPGQPALVASLSTVRLGRSTLTGGAGARNVLFNYDIFPGPGISSNDSHLTIAGTPPETCRAGNPVGIGSAPGIMSTADTLVIETNFPVWPSGGAPAIGGRPASVVRRRVPALLASGAAPGGTIRTDLYAPAGHLAALLLDSVRDPLATPFGTLWLDPAMLLVVGIAVVPATERLAAGVTVPRDAVLQDRLVAAQTADFDGAAAVELTNVAAFSLR